MREPFENWDAERATLLARRISELGLSIEGTLVERLTEQLYLELAAKGIAFRPPVYLSDEWGCPDGTPLIGVPFYLVDPRLARIEEEIAAEVESEQDIMRYLRHEAGHAVNYAYRLYERAEWHQVFGPYSRPYRHRFRADPLSRAYVRHILGWYAQKHPDEDFAETFAVWLTPELDWRAIYANTPALGKLEFVDRLMREVGPEHPDVPDVSPDDLPVEVMHYTVAEHYQSADERLALDDPAHFDGDLRSIFTSRDEAAEPAAELIRRHRRQLVGRIAYWTGESPFIVRSFVDLLIERAELLQLRVGTGDLAALVELTAFATAVMMNLRYTDALDGTPDGGDS